MSNTLLMPFTTDDPQFTLGFEIGVLWEKISQGEILDKYMIHAENIEQFKIMMDTFGQIAEIEELDGWALVTTTTLLDELLKMGGTDD